MAAHCRADNRRVVRSKSCASVCTEVPFCSRFPPHGPAQTAVASECNCRVPMSHHQSRSIARFGATAEFAIFGLWRSARVLLRPFAVWWYYAHRLAQRDRVAGKFDAFGRAVHPRVVELGSTSTFPHELPSTRLGTLRTV